MSQFDCEDVQLDYNTFLGAATYLLKRIEADPPEGLSKGSFESPFMQKGHPSYRDTRKHAEWLLKMTQRCCFSKTSFLCTLIYVERLRCSKHRLALYESTWRSTWVAMSVISEERWEDNYIHPGHIHNTYGSTHKTVEQQKMQLKLFEALDFNLHVDLDEYREWQNELRDMEKDYIIEAVCTPQRIFIPRPIPNLKTRKTPANTPSTTANSESESEGSERRYPRQSLSKKHDAQKQDTHNKSNHLLTTSQLGYTLTQTPRAHGDGQTLRHMAHHGAATCRRHYHSQLNCDWAPQPVPELRPGACARDLPATQTSLSRNADYWQLDHSATDLRMQELNHRMQQLNQQRGADLLRTSCWHSEHQQQGVYQQRQRFAAHRTSMFDHTNPMASWTARAPQYDMNYPRSNLVAWS